MPNLTQSVLSVLNASHSISEMQKQNELSIDEEFASLIPPLTPDEFSGLEQSILAEGCRDPLIVWNGIIVDGHNRYRICKAHSIPFQTVQKEFASRDDAMLWMLRNQLSRRNLNDFQRIEMVRKCESAVKAQAEQRMLTGKSNPMVNLSQGTSRDALGAMAGVSGSTYEHATAVLDNAPEPVIEATRKKELSINAAYEVTRMDSDKQAEISERIRKGESAQKVVADAKQKKNEAKQKNTNMWYWKALIRNAEETARTKQDIEAVIGIVSHALQILQAANGSTPPALRNPQ